MARGKLPAFSGNTLSSALPLCVGQAAIHTTQALPCVTVAGVEHRDTQTNSCHIEVKNMVESVKGNEDLQLHAYKEKKTG